MRIFVTTAPISLPRVHEVAIDARVVGFAGALSLFAALTVALLPAWRLGRGNLESVLRSGGRASVVALPLAGAEPAAARS